MIRSNVRVSRTGDRLCKKTGIYCNKTENKKGYKIVGTIKQIYNSNV